MHHSRGGYYKNWLDQHPDKPGDGQGPNNEGDDDDDAPPEAEPDEEEGEIDPNLREKGKGVDHGEPRDEDKSPDDKNQAEDIQILDLHSKRPIIAYRGRVFEGQWAEVIGTEAIFTNRDSENPLPALRQLEGNVDLLAASASRILTTERILKPKVAQEDTLAAIREEWNIRIPVGKDKSGEKAQQTRFLENLIALKRKKGETDQVTVYAKPGAGKDFRDNRDPDYKPRRKRRIFDENGQEIFPQKTRSRGRGRGRRSRERGSRYGGNAVRARDEEAGSETFRADSSLSTPTPARWTLLEDKDDENDEDYVSEESENDGDEDISMNDA